MEDERGMLPNSRLHHVLLAGEAHRNKESATAGLNDVTWPVALVDSMNAARPDGVVGGLTLDVTTEADFRHGMNAMRITGQLQQIMSAYPRILEVGIVMSPQVGAKQGYLSPAILKVRGTSNGSVLEWQDNDLTHAFLNALWNSRQTPENVTILIAEKIYGSRMPQVTGPNELRYKHSRYTESDDQFPHTPPRPRRGM